MRLTRKKAIKLCIEAWTICAKTGCKKSELPEKHRIINCECWFCEYDDQKSPVYKCLKCPLPGNEDLRCEDMYYGKWIEAKQIHTRKKYAKLFLEQIKKIK